MKIKNAEFVKGVVGEDSILYEDIPQIAFVGRSNVGKSSTLNALLERKKLVKVANTPGKTREINFFRVVSERDASAYFVDLPGYGYAKLSKTDRQSLENLITWYITHQETNTALICLIIDAKVGLTDLDKTFIGMIKEHNKDFIIVGNKIDKLNQKAQYQLSQELKTNFGALEVFFISARTGKHVNVLQEYIFREK